MLLAVLTAAGSAWGLERRKDQFPTDTGYLISPVPYALPGVGEGIGIIGTYNNIGGTTLDLTGGLVAGDVEGSIAAVFDIPLISKTLLLDLTRIAFNKGSTQVYRDRGMASDGKDFQIVELSDTSVSGGRLTLTFADRRFELFALSYAIGSETSALRDREGDLIARYDPPVSFELDSTTVGTLLDLTDDRTDPRAGLRWQLQRSYTPRPDADSAEYYVYDSNLTAYIPMLESSTLALNYFRSDAQVLQQGLTDRDALTAQVQEQTACDYIPTCDAADLEGSVNNTLAENRHGTASALGGNSRLRAYPGGRFRGAFTEFYGAEFRWNFSDEKSPFDLVLARDFRTAVQVALFHEVGTVAESRDALWERSRSATGLGLRLVTSSGFVYRLDVGVGDEGSATTLFFDYPWGNIGQ